MLRGSWTVLPFCPPKSATVSKANFQTEAVLHMKLSDVCWSLQLWIIGGRIATELPSKIVCFLDNSCEGPLLARVVKRCSYP